MQIFMKYNAKINFREFIVRALVYKVYKRVKKNIVYGNYFI